MKVRILQALILPILAMSALCRAQTPPAQYVYAIVGAKIEIGDGRVIAKGTVLLRDGIIEAVGPDVKVPPDAEVIKGDGLTVYPGFISADMSQGLQLPDAKPDQDVPPNRTEAAPTSMREANRKGIRPEIHAADYLALTDDLLKPIRQAGFTTAMILPDGDTMNGAGALVNLSGRPRRESVVSPDLALRFTFRSAGRGFSGYPGSLMGVFALTRQTLLDAQYYNTLSTAFMQGGSRRPPDDETLIALQSVLAGKTHVIYDADTQNQIERAVHLADQFGLNLMLSGGAEAWKETSLLASRKIPVLLTLNFGPDPAEKKPPTTGGPGRPGGRGGFPGRRRGGAPSGSSPNGPPNGPPNNASGGAPSGPPPGDQPNSDTRAPSNAPPNGAASATGGSPASDDEAEVTPPAVIADRHAKWQEKVANATALNRAGVPFVFSTRAERNASDFFADLRKAITAGLPRDVALRALTIDAAHLFGVERQLGTVEAGKTAAVIVMSGDFVDEKSTVKYLFIDREKFEPGKDTPTTAPLPFRRFPVDDDDRDGTSDGP